MSRGLTMRVVLMAAWAGGCAGTPHEHDGRLVAEYHPGGATATAPAPYRADYALYQSDDNPGGPGGGALLWRGLAEQEAVGFATGAGGELAAVAGPERIPLAEGRYCWRVTPESQPRGAELVGHEARKAVAAVGRATGRVALGILLLPLVVLWGLPVAPFGP